MKKKTHTQRNRGNSISHSVPALIPYKRNEGKQINIQILLNLFTFTTKFMLSQNVSEKKTKEIKTEISRIPLSKPAYSFSPRSPPPPPLQRSRNENLRNKRETGVLKARLIWLWNGRAHQNPISSLVHRAWAAFCNRLLQAAPQITPDIYCYVNRTCWWNSIQIRCKWATGSMAKSK